MKALFLSLALLSISTLASAGLVGEFPKVQFGSTFVSVENVCVNGDYVQTIDEVTVCVKRDNRAHGYCAVTQAKILSTPIHFSKEIPGTHNKFQVIEGSIATSYQVPFGYPSKNGIRVVKIEKFNLPACE